MDLLENDNYREIQYLLQHFCKYDKIPFTGDDQGLFYVLDIQETIPILEQCVTDNKIRETLEENEWIVEIDFETMKSIFEPVVQKIFCLIKAQLENAHETCSAMFLVGGFSESKKELNKSLVSSYGIKNTPKWKEGDPVHRKILGVRIYKFHRLVERGTKMDINQEVTKSVKPVFPDQNAILYELYYTQENDAEYCDDPGVELLGELHIDLPGSDLDRYVLFGMTFGKIEIDATSKNKQICQSYKLLLNLN
ncbi:hypothetical protein GLOIN_2v1783264 [Rhizophagus clarus]|uniref:Uncharacterized protein n=1 Tax=Rhizophagus clarus TaxID=94130 RepID=A0A8H3M393_9GLOM|nr:hypothetical protein GLOIN_2v1783264 [Rhizophagus clarus]